MFFEKGIDTTIVLIYTGHVKTKEKEAAFKMITLKSIEHETTGTVERATLLFNKESKKYNIKNYIKLNEIKANKGQTKSSFICATKKVKIKLKNEDRL